MSIREAYSEAIAAHGHTADAAQLRVVDSFENLQQRLQSAGSQQHRLLRLLPGRANYKIVPGIYLWGGVGRGKTFLMDLFFSSLAVERKKRMHFHRMMLDIHARLKVRQDVEDPLDRIAGDIAAETRVLCFDEFFVSDIGDAMILGRLLDGLFRRGVTLVATSNSRPADLYPGGLQRDRFLPAIALLEQHTEVIRLDGDIDYRLQLLQTAGTYLSPPGQAATDNLQRYFAEIASGEIVSGQVLEIRGRAIRTVRCAKGIVWFDFQELCDGPRSQDDYIEIARWYPTVIVSGIPRLGRQNENAARRFVALVDEFYDRRVKLIVSAAALPQELYGGTRLKFAFERTASRLAEMQTGDYLHAAHLS
jgi:cell division protein ZapE